MLPYKSFTAHYSFSWSSTPIVSQLLHEFDLLPRDWQQKDGWLEPATIHHCRFFFTRQMFFALIDIIMHCWEPQHTICARLDDMKFMWSWWQLLMSSICADQPGQTPVKILMTLLHAFKKKGEREQVFLLEMHAICKR